MKKLINFFTNLLAYEVTRAVEDVKSYNTGSIVGI